MQVRSLIPVTSACLTLNRLTANCQTITSIMATGKNGREPYFATHPASLLRYFLYYDWFEPENSLILP
jgi:hypothetical protein